MVDFFSQCTDSCGWVAALIAALAYGSFGVPVKATKHIDVHPLVLQSYKTFVMFATCWLVTLLGVEVGFTKWGLLSGLLWVVGGTGGIYGIRMAGLAIAVGTWASIMIMVNFIFGILIFREPVHDILGTLASFLLLIVGLVGMSHFSAPRPKVAILSDSTSVPNGTEQLVTTEQQMPLEDPVSDGEPTGDYASLNESILADAQHDAHFVLFGFPLTKRQCGIMGAAVNGVFTGGSLIPLHYAKEEGFGGANYIISMACGAFFANCMLMLGFFVYNLVTSSSLQDASERMPRWYFSQLWRPGFLAGLLLSIAMFGSILAVTFLGQGVGNSLVQTKILVSGLWGIFYYKEITGTGTIAKWFLSATVAVAAIVWLSLERLLATGGEGGGHRFLLLDS